MVVDYQWYAAMGATEVWRARLANLLILTGATAVVASLFVFANLYIVRRSIVSVVLPRQMANLEIGEEVPSRYLTGATALMSLALGILLALPPEPWTELGAARYGIPFGDEDPYLQADLGFYVYWLPLENALFLRALLAFVATVIVIFVLYVAVTPGLRWDRARFHVTAHVRRHAAALIPFAFGLLAWFYRLDAFAVLTRGGGPGAFSYADHHFALPAERALALVLLAAGVVAAAALWRGQTRTTLAVVTGCLVLTASYHLLEPVIGHASSPAEETRREQPYGVVRSQATRTAYSVERLKTVRNLDSVPVRYPSLAAAALNISDWDPAALTLALERARRPVASAAAGTSATAGAPEGRLAGGVLDAVGWQWSQNGLLALAIEYGTAAEPDGAGSSLESGAVLGIRATTVADGGSPSLADLAGRPSNEPLRVPPILIFNGAVGSVVVPDSQDRVAAPRVDGFGARLAQAWSAQQLSLLSVDLPAPRPKLVARRDVRDRLRALVPFFAQGTTPWPAIYADSLYWIVDLYSTADFYPLSDQFFLADERRSYFKHAATALVQAHTGRVVLVADSVRDPIAETWVRRFPRMFVRWSAVPPLLARASPPAADGALATAQAFAAAEGRGAQPANDSHAMPMRLASSDHSDSVLASGQLPCMAAAPGGGPCAWSIPLVDAGDRVAGLVVATGGADRGLMWVPLDSTGPHWPAMLERLQHKSDSVIMTRRETSVARGRARALLVGHRLALFQPQYAWHSDAAPTLISGALVMGTSGWGGPTLADAVGNSESAASGGSAGGGDVGGSGAGGGQGGNPAALRARLGVLYDAMQSALRRGDLTAFGSAYAEMGRLLGRSPEPHAPPAGPRSP